jgi:RNA polymerase sigma factor for flagellar operon FliA
MPLCADYTASSREQLLLEHLPQVQYIARRIHERLPPQVPIEDLVQCGILGLMDAVRRYDPKKKVKLRHYAEFRIRGAILDSLRKGDWASRAQRRSGRKIEQAIASCRSELGRDPTEAEIASSVGMKLEALQRIKSELRTLEIASLEAEPHEIPAENAGSAFVPQEHDPYHEAMKSEMAGLVEKALEALPKRERDLLDMYYFKELTMKEVAAALGVGESRVSQIHASILSRLRASLQML